MERDFYVHIDQFGEEHVYEEKTAEEIIKEFKKVEDNNDIRVIWDLVDFMKSNYDQGNDEVAELYYQAVISVIKENLESKK